MIMQFKYAIKPTTATIQQQCDEELLYFVAPTLLFYFNLHYKIIAVAINL